MITRRSGLTATGLAGPSGLRQIGQFWLFGTALLVLQVHSAFAQDPAPSPGLDLSALASLASNPQIMSMVSSLFNHNNPKPSVGTVAALSTSQQDQTGVSDQDPNSIAQPVDPAPAQAVEPLRKNPRLSSAQSVDAAPKASSSPSSAPSTSSNPVNGLMSFLPALNLGGLSGLFNQNKPTAQPTGAAQASSGSNSSNQQSGGSAPATNNSNSASAVINQVLSAYAAGQIPNELIQLGLSGKVPPQMLELALSGQVPPQLIQMIITGKVPVSTINAFLATMQPPAPTTPPSVGFGPSASTKSPSLARVLLENLFNRQRESSSTISLPTLIGPVPIQLPFTNMRKFGQIVGGTISNVASMFPI